MSAEYESKEDRTARESREAKGDSTTRAGRRGDRRATDAAPFPPERPDDDQRPDSQKEGEARASAAALAGEHGTDGPPQYLDAPEPEGHNAGDYSIVGDTKGKAKGKGKHASGDEDETGLYGNDKGQVSGSSSS